MSKEPYTNISTFNEQMMSVPRNTSLSGGVDGN